MARVVVVAHSDDEDNSGKAGDDSDNKGHNDNINSGGEDGEEED